MQYHFKAREILRMSKAELWSLKDAKVVIEYDDGKKQTTTRGLIYSGYVWKLHCLFPSLPLKSEHALNLDQFSLKKHLEIFSNIYRDFIDTYYFDESVTLEHFWKAVYKVTNEIENDFKIILETHICSISITDFVDLLEHDDIREANWEVEPTQASINSTYAKIDRVLLEDDGVSANPIAFVRRSEIVDRKQILQCIGPRGFCTDINSRIFEKPILYGFAHGLRSLFDAMAESRSATKALIYQTGTALENSQYFNREMQILCQNVRDLVPGDCGSLYTIPYPIKPGQIENLKGIYYYDDAGNLKMIEGDKEKDKDIINKTINIRTPFGCRHPERQAVCTTCFGAVGISVPKGTNPGHVSAIALGEVITQLVLSTKHVEGSSDVDSIELAETYRYYLEPTSDELSLRLAEPLLEGRVDERGRVYDNRIKIELTAQQGERIPSALETEELEQFKADEITEMESVDILTYDENGEFEERMRVPISKGARYGSLSHSMLRHLKFKSYEISSSGNYSIDLGGWFSHESVFTLPLKHTSMTAFQDEAKKFIFSKGKGARASLQSFVNEGEPKGEWTEEKLALAVEVFHDFITSKIPKINLSHILMVTYAMSARDPANGDYRLPRGGESFRICANESTSSHEELLRSRSIGQLMGYQAHRDGPNTIRSYIQREGRPSHPMDEFLISDDS